MKDVDFLPRAYREARRRKHLARRNTLYVLALILGLGGLHWANASRIESARASLLALRSGNDIHMLLQNQLAALQTQKRILQERETLVRRLEDDAPLDGVLAELTRHLSPAMALTAVSLESSSLPEGDAILDRGPTQIALTGVAADNMQIGIFFGRLAESELFDRVRLGYTRQFDEQGRQMREFQILLTLQPVDVATDTDTGESYGSRQTSNEDRPGSTR